MLTEVVNLKHNQFDVYIGRTKEKFHFGNPFSSHSHSLAEISVNTRAESIEKFEAWIRGEDFHNVEPERRQWILDNLHELDGKRLGCFCSPLKCHGDVYIKIIEEQKQFEY